MNDSNEFSRALARLRARLLAVSAPSAVLLVGVGCSGNTTSDTPNTATGGSAQGGTGGSATGGTGGTPSGGTGGTLVDSGKLDAPADVNVSYPKLPIPDGGYPSCDGTWPDGGLVGPCCQAVRCIDPTDTACPPASALTYTDFGMSVGSGTCGCSTIQGPFDHDSAAPYAETPGACCYIVPTMGCTGRPLIVDGRVRTAPLIASDAWI